MSTLTINSTLRLSTGYSIPLLGFGVYQNYDTKATVLEAFRAGYRHVDSAQAYRNESHVGAAVKESGLDREEVFITSKCISRKGNQESTLQGVDASLDRFNFEYIDLFLLHDPLAGKNGRLTTYQALQEAREAGKIRSVGVSNFGVKHLEEIREAGFEMPAVNQIELHPLCQQQPIVSYCQQHSIAVQAYCPILRGKMDHPVIQEISAKVHSNLLQMFSLLILSPAWGPAIYPQLDRDPAQILLRWSLQKGFIPLPKSVTPSRIQSNAKLYDFSLESEDRDKLDALDQGAKGAVSWNPVDAN